MATLCGYEMVAIASHGRIPTLTKLNTRYRVIGPLILGGLVAHFYGAYLRDIDRVHRGLRGGVVDVVDHP